MKKIIVAFDGSKHAFDAVNEAKKLLVGFPNAKVTILKVIDISEVDAEWFGLSNNYGKEIQSRIDEVKKQLDELLGEYNVEVLIGDPATEIINYVNGNEYDILIMGIRGLNLLQSFVMGSVSHKVVKYVTCPVLIVK